MDKQDQFKVSAWPVWEWKAQQFLDGIKHWIERGDENGFVAFHADFLSILDKFLSQLINWTENADSENAKQWAGRALAERLQFLKSQEREWRVGNSAFAETRTQFGDRRHARSPRSYLGWLAGDYLRAAIIEKRSAPTFLLRSPIIATEHESVADLLNYPDDVKNWLKKLSDLPDFADTSAAQWAEIVYQKMEKDEESIFKAPEMQKIRSRPARPKRSSREVRLYDFKRTVLRAVIKLASKPPGHIRGVTRPT